MEKEEKKETKDEERKTVCKKDDDQERLIPNQSLPSNVNKTKEELFHFVKDELAEVLLFSVEGGPTCDGDELRGAVGTELCGESSLALRVAHGEGDAAAQTVRERAVHGRRTPPCRKEHRARVCGRRGRPRRRIRRRERVHRVPGDLRERPRVECRAVDLARVRCALADAALCPFLPTSLGAGIEAEGRVGAHARGRALGRAVHAGGL